MEYLSNSQKQTEEIAFEYAKTLKKGDVVLLSGDLGIRCNYKSNIISF